MVSQVRQLVGMVFQDADCQIVAETVAEDVAFGPENLGLTNSQVAARVEAALLAMGIEHLARKPIHHLSGGEKRRVAIAGVLAMEPQVIVFDEPFANLDYCRRPTGASRDPQIASPRTYRCGHHP